MPPRPHSPLRTHSAPPLPEPMQLDILYSPLAGHGGCTHTTKRRTRSQESCRANGQWETACPLEPITPLHPRQGNALPVSKPFSRGPNSMQECATKGEASFRRNVILSPVTAVVGVEKEKRYSPVEAALAKKATFTTVPVSESSVKKKKQNIRQSVVSLSNVPTAYEAALAKYGKMLLSMTHRRKIAEQRQSRKLFSRRKAVNEKYSELSRPPVALGSGRRVSSTRQKGSGAAAQCRENGASVSVPGVKTRKEGSDIAAVQIQPEKELCVKWAATSDHRCCSRKTGVGTAVSHDRGGGQNEYLTGALTASDSVSANLEVEMENGGAAAEHNGCGHRNASAQIRMKQDRWVQTEFFSSCMHPLVNSFPGRKETPKEKEAMLLGDTFYGIRPFTTRSLTPPRPLRRACSPNLRSRFMCEEPRRNKSVFFRILPESKPSYESWVCTSAEDTWHGTERFGRSLHAPEEKTCIAEQKALVFIRPQPKPRPLPRHQELMPHGDDNVWHTQEILFGAPAWDKDEKEDTIDFASHDSCGSRKNEGDELKRATFTNVVPRYVLDGFARRGLLRMAWGRWRERLGAYRVLSPARFKEVGLAEVEDDMTRWPGLRKWLDEAALLSTLP
ncbi:hypothetical protein MOQ_003744 [Trypanosoma cruzi marinkellei]|uniref:Uncharacterized protein n=1 Tax=Trypanosoma cruzi marinkellei TaxID=85056 RepID=K2MB69_TRYCR|nr:hypothetical protein MOQ_003744 [Trypanosoma cruzi marinkellei]